jgi:uncharacterized protein (DUF885 family)
MEKSDSKGAQHWPDRAAKGYKRPMGVVAGRVLAVVVLLSTVARAEPPTAFEARCAGIVAAKGERGDPARLHELFDASWEYQLREYPEFATSVGDPRYDGRWTDWSLEAVARRERELEAPARVLASIEREQLGEPDQLSYDLFRRGVEEDLEGRRFKGEYLQLDQLNGVHQRIAHTLVTTPAATRAQYDDVLARLEGIPALFEQAIVLLDLGLRAGITPPRIVLRDVPRQVESQILDDPDKSPLLAAFQNFPASIPAREQRRLRARAHDAYADHVVPALRRLHDYLAATYVPGARETIAFGDVPDGKAWYAYEVRRSTTTTRTPKEIHELGLSEVKRIRRAMQAVAAEAGYDRLEEFVAMLRTDPRFYFDRREDLLRAFRDIAKRADPELVKLFGKLPRLPYGVLPVPDYAERSQPAAYYEPGSLASGRAGYFFANTYDLPSRPSWIMESLVLHEAVPGHHLQIALAQELEDLPAFRRHGGYTAYSEGWGLYAESLGPELGFYGDSYARFGQLSLEMWRAVRLVVDTGIHAFGWSRERAIGYLRDNTGKTEHESTVEVDRYLVWPAQALAYKIGELELKELRAYATKKLGARFDVRAFHDAVLGGGALPLDVLDSRIRHWVDARAKTRE